ncbi:MAG: 2OG-Fe(II) oxygenase, partial [Spartobacteria bacterium]
MADSEIHFSYAEGFDELVDALETLERPGDFQISGKHETPMPLLSVEGFGQLSFPVPPAQARDLIATAAERAPYGRGEQTIVDEGVRKVWQIAPEKISIEGKGWAGRFEDLVARVAEGLGLLPKEVRAEFYKLLVYDEGGFFLPHRDTEKAGGMFGTLVVSMPSAHEGGELIVRHAGREAGVDLRGTDPGEVGFAAFYADCEHEVRPVTAGHRVCLIYNLILATRRREGDPQPPDERPFIEKAAAAFRNWASREVVTPGKIAYLLEHKYTPSGLSFSGLKGRDAAIAKVLLEAAKSSACAFHIGIVHIEENGWAEYSGWGGSRWDDEEEEAEEYEVGEVCDSYAFIEEWRDSGDRPMDFGKIPLGDKEVLPPDALDGEEPDEIQFSEATGNAGADFERAYLRAAVVIWPEASYDEICLSVGVEAGVARLEVLARSGAKPAVARLAAVMFEKWRSGDSKSLNRFLQALTANGDPELIERLLPGLLQKSYDGLQNDALIEAVKLLPLNAAERILAAHIEMFGPFLSGAVLNLWNRLAAMDRFEGLVPSWLGILLTALEKQDPLPANSAKVQAKRIEAPVFARFLALVADPRFAEHAARVSALPATNPYRLEVASTLLPALEACFSDSENLPPALANPLWLAGAQFYLSRSETPPPAPVDWAQQANFGNQTMMELQEL